MRNPYAELRSLLDITRQLDPEEMAELHLEQGYIDRALAIYEELVQKDPHNPSYETRRAWLARIQATTERKSAERVKIEQPAGTWAAPRARSHEPTLYGVPAPLRKAVEHASHIDMRRIVRVK